MHSHADMAAVEHLVRTNRFFGRIKLWPQWPQSNDTPNNCALAELADVLTAWTISPLGTRGSRERLLFTTKTGTMAKPTVRPSSPTSAAAVTSTSCPRSALCGLTTSASRASKNSATVSANRATHRAPSTPSSASSAQFIAPPSAEAKSITNSTIELSAPSRPSANCMATKTRPAPTTLSTRTPSCRRQKYASCSTPPRRASTASCSHRTSDKRAPRRAVRPALVGR